MIKLKKYYSFPLNVDHKHFEVDRETRTKAFKVMPNTWTKLPQPDTWIIYGQLIDMRKYFMGFN